MMAEEPEAGGDEAAAAFEALRVEVAELRRLVEASSAAADYAPTLGTMTKLLARIETHPALQMTPQGYASQVRETVQGVQRSTEQGLRVATGRIEAAANQLQEQVGQVRVREIQQKRLLQVGAAALVIGAAIWIGLSGPIARALPQSWHVPEQMAAATLGRSRWTGGAQMMESEDPQAWNSIVGTLRLEKVNETVLEACHVKAVQFHRRSRCNITIEP